MIKKILIGISVIILIIIFAGMYKFNYLASQPGYDVDGNKIITKNAQIF
jgi:PDZ domain-containing secreted protein